MFSKSNFKCAFNVLILHFSNYRPPTKLREGNVFSRVCLSSCLSVYRRGLHEIITHDAIGQSQVVSVILSRSCPRHVQLVYLDFTIHGTPPSWTCSNLFTWTSPHKPPLPRHVQTCSVCTPDCRQAGGWHSTEIPSCLKRIFKTTICTSQQYSMNMIRNAHKKYSSSKMGETNFSLSNYTAFLYIFACLRNFIFNWI